jgi:hypothetical protein
MQTVVSTPPEYASTTRSARPIAITKLIHKLFILADFGDIRSAIADVFSGKIMLMIYGTQHFARSMTGELPGGR